MLEFCQPFGIHLCSMSAATRVHGERDLLLIEEGSGLLIPKGIVQVTTEVSSAGQVVAGVGGDATSLRGTVCAGNLGRFAYRRENDPRVQSRPRC